MSGTILCKRPVAFRWRNLVGQWCYDGDETKAASLSAGDYDGLYVRDGTAIVSEWKPIETAPIGERVLIYGKHTGIICWTNESDENEWPDGTTRWMELPAPPSEIG